LLNLQEQAMRDPVEIGRSARGEALGMGTTPIAPMPTLLPRIDRRTLPRELAVVVDSAAIKMYPASRYAWQHSSRFSVVAVLACLWRPF
jgi:hypothetical protein